MFYIFYNQDILCISVYRVYRPFSKQTFRLNKIITLTFTTALEVAHLNVTQSSLILFNYICAFPAKMSSMKRVYTRTLKLKHDFIIYTCAFLLHVEEPNNLCFCGILYIQNLFRITATNKTK